MIAITAANTRNLDRRSSVAILPKTYDKKGRAQAAAVRELGEHAREGFEYETTKVDGRWIWRATEGTREPTHAQLKANGGKRSVVKIAQELADRAQGNPASDQVRQLTTIQSQPAAELVVIAPNDMTRRLLAAMRNITASGMGEWRVVDLEAIRQKLGLGKSLFETHLDILEQNKVFRWRWHMNTKNGQVCHEIAGAVAPTGATPAAPAKKSILSVGGPVALRSDGLKAGSSAATLVDTVCRPGGATNEELCAAVGWKECLPAMRKYAEKAGVTIRTEKKPGERTRYFGTKAS